MSHIASVTKAFTATAIGELVAEGKMDWDKTAVNNYLPEFELKDPVLTSQLTLTDMLAHRTVSEHAAKRKKIKYLVLITCSKTYLFFSHANSNNKKKTAYATN